MTYASGDDWPAFNDELSRKVSAVLEKWLALNNDGKVRDREIYILVDGLWDAVSGLVNKDVLRLMEAILEEIKANARRPKT